MCVKKFRKIILITLASLVGTVLLVPAIDVFFGTNFSSVIGKSGVGSMSLFGIAISALLVTLTYVKPTFYYLKSVKWSFFGRVGLRISKISLSFS